MDIKKLFELSKRDPDASKRAAVGLKDRIQARNRVFHQESRKLGPSERFYERIYDI